MLIIANTAMQTQPAHTLQQLGFDTEVAGDPYSAMAVLMSPGARYRGCVLSLQSIYREEIAMVRTLKRELPQLEVWLAHTDHRQAAMAEAMRCGADGLLGDEGLHRIASASSHVVEPDYLPPMSFGHEPMQLNPSGPITDVSSVDGRPAAQPEVDDDPTVNEPVLTADELRALLQEQPTLPPSGGSEN